MRFHKLKKIIIGCVAGILMLGFGFGFGGFGGLGGGLGFGFGAQTALADWTNGKFNAAMDFNGTSDFIFAGDTEENVKTILFWIKADDITERKILQLAASTDYYVEINDSSHIVAQNFASPTYYIDGTAIVSPSNPTIDANWHFVAITTATAIDASSVYLGRAFVSSTNYYFDGVLDDVKFYDRVLTAKEIAEHYRQDAPSLAQGGTISDSSTVGAALTIRQDSTGDILNLYDGSTEVFTVLDGGSVGIGTVAPINLLEINGSLGMYTNPGSDKVTNGTFTGNATDWTLAAGWAYNSDNVHKNGDGVGTMYQDVSAVANETYKVVFTISGWSVGTVTPSVGGVSGTARGANGTYTEYITATDTGNLIFTPTTSARFTIDDVSVKKMAKAATDHIAMWIDDTGAVAGKAGLYIRTEDGTSHVFGDNVGIGDTTPGGKLTINASGNLNFGDINDELIDDMEAIGDWELTEVGVGHTTLTLESTIEKMGDGAMKITTTSSGLSTGDTIKKEFSSNQDFSTYDRIGFWVRATATGQIFTIKISDTVAADSTHAVTIDTANKWYYEEWDISGITSTSRDIVDYVQLYIDDDTGAPTIYIDQLRYYDKDDRSGEMFVGADGKLVLAGGQGIELLANITSSLPALSIDAAIVEINQPFAVNVAGDTGINYDLQFLNTGTTFVTSAGPLVIAAGDPNHAENLTLTTQSNIAGGDSGRATAGDASLLTDTPNTWTPNEWAGGTVSIISGTGVGQVRTISSNTDDDITTSATWTVNPASNSYYTLAYARAGDILVNVAQTHMEIGGFKILGNDSSSYIFKVAPDGDVTIGGNGLGGSDLTVKQNITLTGGNITIGQLDISDAGIPTTTITASGGLCADTTYYYKITAVNDNGETTGCTQFSKATGAATSQVTIAWTSVSGATGYKIYRSTDNDDWDADPEDSWVDTKVISSLDTVYTDDCDGDTISQAPPTANTTGGDLIAYGNVGIGTTGPDAKLDVLDISGAQMRLTYTDNTVFTDFTLDSNGNLEIKSTPASTHGDVKLTSSVSTGANLYVCEGTGCNGVSPTSGGNLIVENTIYEGTTALGACDGIQEVYDIDGNRYNTVVIGSQCWMTENMRTTKYPDKTAITKGPITHIVAGWDNIATAHYSCPPNADEPAADAEDCNTAYRYGEDATPTVTGTTGTGEAYGLFYSWSAAMKGSTAEEAQGICPNGWHVPTDTEYKTLEVHLGMCEGEGDGSPWCVDKSAQWRGTNEGSKLASNAALWKDVANGIDTHADFGESGFNALAPGYRNTNGGYYNRSDSTNLWSSTQSGDNAWKRHLRYTRTDVYRNVHSKAIGFSVRCIKD